MLNGLLIAANSVISLCYFIIAFLILLPYLRGQQKTALVLATICVFFSCALGHGGHVLMMLSGSGHPADQSPVLLKLQVGIDSITAVVAITYIALRRYFSFLVDGPLLLTQAQAKLAVANAELKSMNTRLESLVAERTGELEKANQELAATAAERKQIIAALNRSNAFLKAQQEAGVDGILVVDEHDKVVFYNQNFYQIWQVPEELVQQGDDRKILELVVTKPVDSEEFIKKVDYLYKHKDIISRDEILLKDERTLDRYTAPIYSQEIYYGRIWFFRDVTEGKVVEEQLRQSKEFLQLIIDVMPQFIAWKDCNSVFLGCNQKLALIAGLETPEQIIGKTDYDLAWQKEEADFLRLCDKQVMESNQAQMHIIEPQRQADGKEAWLDTCKLPLHHSNGQVIGILVVLEDITERKAASDALQASQDLLKQKADLLAATLSELQQAKEFLQLLINIMPQAIVWKDSNSVCLGCNQKFAVIAGVESPELIIGKTDYDLAWKREEADFLRIWDRQVIKSNQAQLHIVKRQQLADGKKAWLDICLLPLRDKSGQVIGLLAVLEDITERKAASDSLLASEVLLKQKANQLAATLSQLQQTQAQLVQSEKMSALGQLVAGVAHEINNPVNFIYGNLTHVSEYMQDLMSLLQVYQREYPNPSASVSSQIKEIDYEYLISDMPKLLSSMKTGAERIRQIVLSLRTFSRLDEAAMKTVNIHDGLDSTLLILQSRLKTKVGLEIKVIKNYASLPEVQCYPGQLNQVFLNILSNAIEALEIENGNLNPTIEICTQLKHKRVVITIADNGLGILQPIQKQIFDPFFTTKPVGQGTGLGLAISYQIIVDKHKGSLQFTSKPGWTEFWIEIPLVQKE